MSIDATPSGVSREGASTASPSDASSAWAAAAVGDCVLRLFRGTMSTSTTSASGNVRVGVGGTKRTDGEGVGSTATGVGTPEACSAGVLHAFWSSTSSGSRERKRDNMLSTLFARSACSGTGAGDGGVIVNPDIPDDGVALSEPDALVVCGVGVGTRGEKGSDGTSS